MNRKHSQVAVRSTSKRPRFLAFLIAVVLAFSLSLVPTQAHAATSVNVRWGGICSIHSKIDTNTGSTGAVNFNLGSHSSRYLTLHTNHSWGWQRGNRGNNLAGKWNNRYDVRFLNSKGHTVWSEYGAIPNGGQRRFYVGSNVRTIQVTAGPGKNAFGWAMRPLVPAGVGYAS